MVTRSVLERGDYWPCGAFSWEEIECTALTNGEIIEQYPTDYPFPSCLVLGHTGTEKPLHIVCGSNGAELWLITVYIPSPADWTEDFRQRRKV